MATAQVRQLNTFFFLSGCFALLTLPPERPRPLAQSHSAINVKPQQIVLTCRMSFQKALCRSKCVSPVAIAVGCLSGKGQQLRCEDRITALKAMRQGQDLGATGEDRKSQPL